ncbi:RNA methyltransferase [Marinoscillum sp. MHG1-6]|uniref:TrmH family RNA methyltransferase n=1 Tax=Marinoscillum sp. MHG1-6 TaxID=2959627 RepID=UPI002157BD60|nr:RNA methyltransferase [Marinoscillum sp. MHG1-6]
MVSKNRLKFIKSLKIKKYRQKERSFLVEGRKNVLELINSDFEVQCILATNKFISSYGNTGNNLEIHEVNSDLLAEVGSFQTNEDCLAVASMKPSILSELIISKPTFVLDGVGDPGNLGTIIRTLDWFGHDTLICSSDTAEFYNPKVINSTMGSFTRVKVYYTALKEYLTNVGLPIYGADLDGVHPRDCDFSVPSLMVMGSESHGLSEEVKPLINHFVSIPGSDRAESLNVAMATGILAYQAYH